MVDRVKERLRAARHRHPFLDHLIRAYDRNSEVLGGQLAGSVTYFGFLSFFPVLALAFFAIGWISEVYPAARGDLVDLLEQLLPGTAESAAPDDDDENDEDGDETL